ncbi:ABC transporter substrate-binding protein [Paraburkholderia xenovorans]
MKIGIGHLPAPACRDAGLRSNLIWFLRAVLLPLAVLASAGIAHAASSYVINTILPLTGPTSFLGKGEQTALQVLEKAVNSQGGIQGRSVRFEFKDDQSSAQQAVQVASQLVAQGVPVIIGPSTVSECNAVAPILRESTFMYCASPGFHPKAGSYAFTSYVEARDLVKVSLRYLRLRGWTKIALLTTTDASGQDATAALKEALKDPENNGVQLVAEATFNPLDISVSAQVERIKAARPQALITWTTGGPTGVMLKGLEQGGVQLPTVISASNMTHAQMMQYRTFLPKEVYFAATAWPEHGDVLKLAPEVETQQQLFHAGYKAAGLATEGPPTYIWDSAVIVIDALRKLGVNANAKQIHDYVASMKDIAGINGTYDFVKVPQRGLSESDTVMTMWDPAKQAWRVVSKPVGLPIQ